MNTRTVTNLYPAAEPRFVDNRDGTVTDISNHLMWSKATVFEEAVGQFEAVQICGALSLAGHTDWRLPTDRELQSLVDRSRFDPTIDTESFPDTSNDWYWTVTECAWAAYDAWAIHFGYGHISPHHRYNENAFVRVVRSQPAGECQPGSDSDAANAAP